MFLRRLLVVIATLLLLSVQGKMGVDLGTYSLPITCQLSETQFMFNQGIMHQYGFNEVEAQLAFRECIEFEPTCAMCYWGLAYSLGPFLNQPVISSSTLQDAEWAAMRAWEFLHTRTDASDLEHALVHTMKVRYATANQTLNALEYAQGFADMKVRFPSLINDDDVNTLHAEALMDITAADYYYNQTSDSTGRMKDTALEAKALLEKVMDSSDHPMALHLYIHIIEPRSPADAKIAEDAADRLRDLDIVDSGHLEHMPGHLYMRIGRYDDAILTNMISNKADELYMDSHLEPYSPGHAIVFLINAATMDGQRKVAYEYGPVLRGVYAKRMDIEDSPGPEVGWNAALVSFMRFGDFQMILDDDQVIPGLNHHYATVLRQFSKGIAAAALGGNPQMFLEQLVMQMENIVDDGQLGLAKIAKSVLTARIHLLNDDDDKLVPELENAKGIQDSFLYQEPQLWYFPIRQCLGAAQLRSEMYSDADKTYREDLTNYPDNGWSLYGLIEAMKKQPDEYSPGDIEEMQNRLTKSWSRSDVELTSSCMLFGF